MFKFDFFASTNRTERLFVSKSDSNYRAVLKFLESDFIYKERF